MKNLDEIMKALPREYYEYIQTILKLSKNGLALYACSDTEKKDVALIKIALLNNPNALEYIPLALRTKEMCLLARGKNFKIDLVPTDLRKDLDIVQMLLEMDLDVAVKKIPWSLLEKGNLPDCFLGKNFPKTDNELLQETQVNLIFSLISQAAKKNSFIKLPDWLANSAYFQSIHNPIVKTSTVDATAQEYGKKNIAGQSTIQNEAWAADLFTALEDNNFRIKIGDQESFSFYFQALLTLYKTNPEKHHQVVTKFLEANGLLLRHIQYAEQNILMVLVAVSQNAFAIEDACLLKNNKAIQWVAFLTNPASIKHCPGLTVEELRKNPPVIKYLCMKNMNYFKYFVSDISQDEKVDVFFTLIQQHKLDKDNEFLAKLWSYFGKEATHRLPSVLLDKNMLATIFSHHGQALQFLFVKRFEVLFAGQRFEMSQDGIKKLVMDALKAGFTVPQPDSTGTVFDYIPKFLHTDLEILTYLIEKNPHLINSLSQEVQNNAAFYMTLSVIAIRKDQNLCQAIDPACWKNLEFVTAIKNFISPDHYGRFVSEEIKIHFEWQAFQKTIQGSVLPEDIKKKLLVHPEPKTIGQLLALTTMRETEEKEFVKWGAGLQRENESLKATVSSQTNTISDMSAEKQELAKQQALLFTTNEKLQTENTRLKRRLKTNLLGDISFGEEEEADVQQPNQTDLQEMPEIPSRNTGTIAQQGTSETEQQGLLDETDAQNTPTIGQPPSVKSAQETPPIGNTRKRKGSPEAQTQQQLSQVPTALLNTLTTPQKKQKLGQSSSTAVDQMDEQQKTPDFTG